jgi:hypothetical protein
MTPCSRITIQGEPSTSKFYPRQRWRIGYYSSDVVQSILRAPSLRPSASTSVTASSHSLDLVCSQRGTAVIEIHVQTRRRNWTDANHCMGWRWGDRTGPSSVLRIGTPSRDSEANSHSTCELTNYIHASLLIELPYSGARQALDHGPGAPVRRGCNEAG